MIPKAPSPKIRVAMPPTMTAPRVLAMVFRVRIAELVSSISSRNFCRSKPTFGFRFLRDSMSVGVVLRIIASINEQKAEIPSVKPTAMINPYICK